MSDETRPDEVTPGDDLLKLLVSMANRGADFPLTLFVKGTVVSGILTSRRRYLEAFVEGLTTGWDAENTATIREVFEIDQPEMAVDDEENEGPSPATLSYIHLLDAKVFTPGQEGMPGNGLAWRGRISEVDAFSYGVFGPPR